MSSGGPQVAEQSHAKEQFKRLKRLKRRAKSLWERICGKAVSPPAAQPSPQQLDGAPLEQLPTIEPDSVQRRASLIGVVPRRPTSPTGTLPRNTYEAEGSVKGCPSQDLLPVANDEEMDNLGTSGKSFASKDSDKQLLELCERSSDILLGDTAEKRNDESNGQERASSIEIQPKAAAKPLSIGDLEHQDNHANQAPTQDDAETSSLSTRARSYSSTTNVIGVVDTGLTIKPETDVWTLADQSSVSHYWLAANNS
ncbi:hypothetical protein BKA70DRAFT_1239352 [Coprinopsis sp. MPI-PUGE-AT-0042]|nr:hypothetical protein BKA70DRAFT_1239352 [Coprinopsis sp. MPI-PUGE-AT-0042]